MAANMQSRSKKKVAVVIGAGPAGLTAAYELLKHSDVVPHVFETAAQVGGISKTVNYKGNLIDIGGHRFFSKSEKIMEWWQNIMPIEFGAISGSVQLKYQGKTTKISSKKRVKADATSDTSLLVRHRVSRIYYGGKFYDYPITLNARTLKNLGPLAIIKIGASYLHAVVRPRKERNLEDFYINRFGKVLYGMCRSIRL